MQENFEQSKKILKNKLGTLIKKHRLEQDKSISLISAEIGMTKSMWADLEKGIKDPQMSTFLRICEALNLKPQIVLNELIELLGNNFSMIE
ncbi:transcriptional regulator [Clostridium sp. CAG:715]|nr:transcriptional regulator [Clostridium sp. CAG:715]